MNQDEKKARVAEAALEYIGTNSVIGVGTGSTVNFFISALVDFKEQIQAAVSSSVASEKLLREVGIPVVDMNEIDTIPLYVDGADEANHELHLIKGGGGALTREKIVAAASEVFVCITDDSKLVNTLGKFPLPVEVIPMACNHVANALSELGGRPVQRKDFITDNGNVILDVHDLEISNPVELESQINHLTGVVCNGIFARRAADILLIADENEVKTLK